MRIRRSPRNPEPPEVTVAIALSREEWRFYEMALLGVNDDAAVRVCQKIRRHLEDIADFDLDEAAVVSFDADETRVLVRRGVAYARAVIRSDTG